MLKKNFSKYNVVKFQSPFEKIKYFSDSPEIMLYRAVLVQAMIDASNISDCKSQQIIAQSAMDWFFTPNADFYTTCDKANINPDYVRRTVYKVVELSRKKR